MDRCIESCPDCKGRAPRLPNPLHNIKDQTSIGIAKATSHDDDPPARSTSARSSTSLLTPAATSVPASPPSPSSPTASPASSTTPVTSPPPPPPLPPLSPPPAQSAASLPDRTSQLLHAQQDQPPPGGDPVLHRLPDPVLLRPAMAAPPPPGMVAFDASFRRTDLDRDGRISGAEAVTIFQGANLPKSADITINTVDGILRAYMAVFSASLREHVPACNALLAYLYGTIKEQEF